MATYTYTVKRNLNDRPYRSYPEMFRVQYNLNDGGVLVEVDQDNRQSLYESMDKDELLEVKEFVLRLKAMLQRDAAAGWPLLNSLEAEIDTAITTALEGDADEDSSEEEEDYDDSDDDE